MAEQTHSNKPVIVFFRNDLRIADNRALSAAADSGKPVLPIFVRETDEASARVRGAAKLWWLHHSLTSLSADLSKLGATLTLKTGTMAHVVEQAVKASGADLIFWNRRCDPGRRDDDAMAEWLDSQEIEHADFDGFLVHEPEEVLTKTGGPFKVFTPFWRALSAQVDPRDPVDRPRQLKSASVPRALKAESLDDWALLPSEPDWAGDMRKTWKPGEASAQKALKRFIDGAIADYATTRNLPAVDGTSRFSPHLAHGELTPFQIIHAIRRSKLSFTASNVETFRRELGWRDFCNQLLYRHPDLHRKNFDKSFDTFEWHQSKKNLTAWQRGQTGYPIVDAGMRQLWQTGWMHNRVRLITGSFLVKDLLIPWQDGEAWFWDCLVDADHGDNSANWQWVAGSGADASPYFRIFNPVLQGEKFDRDGEYVRTFVPELAKLPKKFIHKPWTAPQDVLAKAGIELGKTYPRPIVDHGEARDRAMAAYRKTR